MSKTNRRNDLSARNFAEKAVIQTPTNLRRRLDRYCAEMSLVIDKQRQRQSPAHDQNDGRHYRQLVSADNKDAADGEMTSIKPDFTSS